MARPYEMDFRRSVIKACDRGHSTREVAEQFDVSESWVRRLKQRRRERGTIEPLPNNGGRKRKITEVHRNQLKQWLCEEPGLTLAQLQKRLSVDVTLPAIHYVLVDMKLTFKKSH